MDSKRVEEYRKLEARREALEEQLGQIIQKLHEERNNYRARYQKLKKELGKTRNC